MLVFARNINQRDDYVPFHTHNALELVYYIEGSGTTAIDKNRPQKARKHIYAIIPANVPHDQRNQPRLHSICIGLQESGLEEFAGCHEDTGGIIGQIVLDILREAESVSPGSELIREGLCQQLSGMIIRNCRHEQSKPEPKQRIKERTLQIIHDTEGMANVGEIARQLMLSPEYLRRIIKQETGNTPQELLSNARLQKASSLLQQTNLPVNHISRLCGFDSPYYFSRLFKAKTGLAPTDFRKKILHTTEYPEFPQF